MCWSLGVLSRMYFWEELLELLAAGARVSRLWVPLHIWLKGNAKANGLAVGGTCERPLQASERGRMREPRQVIHVGSPFCWQ